LHFLGDASLQVPQKNDANKNETVASKTAVSTAAKSSKNLWSLTLLLTIVQTFLIVFLWAMLFA
jgi:hypothetical protein